MLVKRVVAVALVTLASVASSHAQSFGRNKVRYENFDFQILETPHFDIYYDAAEHDAVVQAGRLAERWYARLSQVLDHTFTERQPIVLYASHAQFTQTNVISDIGSATASAASLSTRKDASSCRLPPVSAKRITCSGTSWSTPSSGTS